jgi:hypothetical protein
MKGEWLAKPSVAITPLPCAVEEALGEVDRELVAAMVKGNGKGKNFIEKIEKCW